MNRVNPSFKKQLIPFGVGNLSACFHCGNCTARCNHSEEKLLIPRNGIRALQMGLEDKIHTSVDPWLCYYCGECSESCPKEANPGEIMMALRRYLTTIYDWTGLSKLLYTSASALIVAFSLVALVMIIVGVGMEFSAGSVMKFGHSFEKLAILSVACIFLLPNIIRMLRITLRKENLKASFYIYISCLADLVVHMFTQKNTLKCETHTIRWLEHLFIVTGYLVLLFTTVFLNWFTTSNLFIQSLGYIVASITFILTALFIFRRLKKKSEVSRFSHHTDWVFVIWLFLIGITSVLVRLFIDLEILQNNLWLYMIHLIVLAQWAILIVPFGKWTHFLYRSFAVSILSLKKASLHSISQKIRVTA